MIKYKFRTQFGVRYVKGMESNWTVTDKSGVVLFTTGNYDQAVQWAYLRPEGEGHE